MGFSLITVAYLVASVLFILSLSGLASQETAPKGNWYGIIGMAIAVGATLTNTSSVHVTTYAGLLGGALGVAVIIGYARKDQAPNWLHSHYEFQIRTF